MKRFRPEVSQQYTALRQATLENMGLPSASDLLVHAAGQIEHWCGELADKDDLSVDQKAGMRGARRDVSIAIGALHDLIVDRLMTREQKEDMLFLLAKLIDDCIEVGYYSVIDKKSGLRSHRVLIGAKSGGDARGEQVAQEADLIWRDYAETWVIAQRTDRRHLTIEEIVDELKENLAERDVHRSAETLKKFVAGLKDKMPSRVPLPRKSLSKKR